MKTQPEILKTIQLSKRNNRELACNRQSDTHRYRRIWERVVKNKRIKQSDLDDFEGEWTTGWLPVATFESHPHQPSDEQLENTTIISLAFQIQKENDHNLYPGLNLGDKNGSP